MTDSGIRRLMLIAAGMAVTLLSLPPLTSAADPGESTEPLDADWTIQIVPAGQSEAQTVIVKVTPASLTSARNEVPILIAPKHADKPGARGDTQTKARKSDLAKKKKDAARVAKETASRKALEEWQKRGLSENPKSKANRQAAAKTSKSHKDSRNVVRNKSTRSQGVSAISRKKALLARSVGKPLGQAARRTGPAVGLNHHPTGPGSRDSRSYREIYESIPFSRAEFDANPAYRHQATMEIMLGQLHPVIVTPAAPPQSPRNLAIRFLPIVRSGYRAWSQYPWH